MQACFQLSAADRSAARDAFDRPIPEGADARRASAQVIASCKEVSDDRRRRALAELEQALGVSLPGRPTDEYAGIDWNDVRRLAARGVEFGGHTVTHPILSRVDATTLEREVSESLAAIERATGRRPTTFAYPNGRAQDYDGAAIEALKRHGVGAAVTTEPRVVTRSGLAAADALYRLPRLPFPDHPARQQGLVSGLEAAKIGLGWR